MSDLITLENADHEDLPPLARELIARIGFSATLRLVELRPGVPVYVPEVMPPDHWLALELGMHAASTLAKYYGGTRVDVPSCKLAMTRMRQRQILRSRESGLSQTEAALLHGVTPRWVRELESRDPEPDNNLSLF